MHYVSRVEFILDESFTDHLISISTPPFEIHNSGWGQFTIGLRIHFHDPNVQPIELGKDLVLYDDLMPASAKRPVIREEYNELVFVEPTPKMMHLLQVED